MEDRQQLLDLLNEDIDFEDQDKKLAFFEGEEVIILKSYTRNRAKIALIQTQTNERFEVYYELLDQ